MPQWTKDQQAVIGTPAERIICAAAAGSGKTAVMIERIVRMIREGADCFSFLVITFTNAAAAEMKEKIRKRLTEERGSPEIAAAAEKAGIMEICTIHSFCQHLIRQEFQIPGVDPLFRICSSAERDRLFEESFRQACEQLYAERQEAFFSFKEKYEPAAALEIVRTVHDFMMSLPEPLEWLRTKAKSVPLDYDRGHPWFRTVADMIRDRLLTCRVLLRRQMEMFDRYERIEQYRSVFAADLRIVDAIGRWTDGKEVSREELSGGFVRLPGLRNLNDHETDWRDRYKEIREKLKKECTEMQALILTDREKMKRELMEVRKSLEGLSQLAERTCLCFEENKRRNSVMDFQDLEHVALAILRNPDGQAAIEERYRYVFVDECQDVSAIQDALIEELSSGSRQLFMVGDVKQSIYRFRQARPGLFLRRMKEKREDQICLHLQENFRSRPEILETANVIFRDLMRPGASEVIYLPEEELHQGRTDCPGNIPVQIHLAEPDSETREFEAAALHTADQIKTLVREEGVAYRDIVILMPEVSRDGPVLTELLKSEGIPVFFDGQADFFRMPEVDAFRNLLSLLDHPEQDIPLLSVLRNPPFDLTEEELGRIRLQLNGKDIPFRQAFRETMRLDTEIGKKCREIGKRLEEWRFQSKHRPLGDFCWYLMEESTLYSVFGAGEYGRSAQKNLRNFCIQASAAQESGQGTLRAFLDHLAEQEASGEMRAASALGDEDQVVRIMTIHKSKGLQFPVVFCLGLDRKTVGSHPAPVLMDEELGLCLPYKVPEYRLSRPTPAEKIFEWKNVRQTKAEKICLLYVALTRAKERLYLVGTKTDDVLWHMNPDAFRVLSAETYLDWILPALYDADKQSTSCSQPSKHWEIRVFEQNQQGCVEKEELIHNLQDWLDSLLLSPPVEKLWKNFAEEEKPETGSGKRLRKYSVSALLQDARDRVFMEETEQTPEEKRTPEYVKKMMKRYQAEKVPPFMRPRPEISGARRGTVIHRFLSLVDLSRMAGPGNRTDTVFSILREMKEAHVFTEEEISLIPADRVDRFFSSEIGQRMLRSEEVHREWDFNLFLPDREMILQGMIDCAFLENGKWILLDYKTDRIAQEEAFVEEYRPQLAWYRTALEKLTGRAVAESWLYSLSLDQAFRV